GPEAKDPAQSVTQRIDAGCYQASIHDVLNRAAEREGIVRHAVISEGHILIRSRRAGWRPTPPRPYGFFSRKNLLPAPIVTETELLATFDTGDQVGADKLSALSRLNPV